MIDGSSNPYVGLRPFEREDSLRFFGRREQTDELLESLRKTRFLSVVGSSGCGKSSLVRAGLIPALLGGFLVEERDRWRIAEARPGDTPLHNLAAALAGSGDSRPAPAMVAGLHEAIVQGHARAVIGFLGPLLGEYGNLLLLVDQFEEIFAFRGLEEEERLAMLSAEQQRERTRRRSEAADFVDLLLELGIWSDLPVYVVLTIRTDFLGDCDLFYGLPEAMNRGRYLVPRLNRRQLRQAIEGPARLSGTWVAPRLMDVLLNELGDRTDRLPVFQHALHRTWEAWHAKNRDGPIDLAHYEKAGTLEKALSNDAEAALDDVEGALEDLGRCDVAKEATARIFKRLTGTDASHRRVRSPAAISELAAVSGLDRSAVKTVLEQFHGAGRHFVYFSDGAEPGDPRVDIAHESLIRQWDRLRKWVDKEREWRDQYWELVERARKQARKRAALLRDPDLGIALDWRAAARPSPAWAKRYQREEGDFELAMAFLDRSERRRKRNSWLLAATVIGVVIVLAVAGGFAWLNWQLAERQKVVAEQNKVVAEKQRDEAEDERRRAELEKVAADEAQKEALKQRQEAEEQKKRAEEKEREARRQEQEALAARDAARNAQKKEEQARAVAELQESLAKQERAAALKAEREAREAEREAQELRLAAEAKALAVRAVSLKEDRLAALLALQAYEINLRFGDVEEVRDVYNALHQTLLRFETGVLHCHDDAVRTLAISADGSKLASGSDDGKILLFDLDQVWDCPARSLASLGSAVQALAFGPENRQLVAGSRDGSLWIWDDPSSGGDGESRRLAAAGKRVDSVAFRPGSRVLAAARSGSGLELWDLAAQEPTPERLELPTGVVDLRSLAFSPGDGSSLAAAGGEAGVLLWSVESPTAPAGVLPVPSPPGDVRSVAFSQDGRFLTAGTVSGIIALWELAGSGTPVPGASPVELEGHGARVEALAFDPRRSLLASASFDRSVRLWDLAHLDALPVVLQGRDWMWSVAFRPGAEQLVSSGNDRTLHLWWTSSKHLADLLCRKSLRPLDEEERRIYLPPEAADLETCPEGEE